MENQKFPDEEVKVDETSDKADNFEIEICLGISFL